MSQHWSDARAGDEQDSSGGDSRGRTAGSGAEPARLDVSVPQVAGGAMASVTAAYLGSYLGVAGTFWGAGLTSVVITVGGALYQRSLERTTDKANAAAAKAALKRAANKPFDGAVAPRAADPAQEATRMIRPMSSSPLSGMHWPGGEQVVAEPGDVRSGIRRCAQQPNSATNTVPAIDPVRAIDTAPVSISRAELGCCGGTAPSTCPASSPGPAPKRSVPRTPQVLRSRRMPGNPGGRDVGASAGRRSPPPVR